MMEWSPEEVAYVSKLWLEGKSASECAAFVKQSFGTTRTRNAIIGRIHREGLSRSGGRTAVVNRAGQIARVKKPKPVRVARVARPVAPKPVKLIADVSNARPWLERTFGQCAFPLGEKGAVQSCCAPTEETYCVAHRQIMGGKRIPWSSKDLRRIERLAA